jgi:hypothetical protein
MSHVVSIATRLEDLTAVELACAELSKLTGRKMTLERNVGSYRWFGTSVGDYPLPAGFSKEDLGKCEHRITVDGCGYDIGLARAKDGKGYVMLFDFWGPGNGLLDALCTAEQAQAVRQNKAACTAGRFMQSYGVHKAELSARKLGYTTKRQTLANGSVNVLVMGRF